MDVIRVRSAKLGNSSFRYTEAATYVLMEIISTAGDNQSVLGLPLTEKVSLRHAHFPLPLPPGVPLGTCVLAGYVCPVTLHPR
jgi:hypothetical protein